jgi:hypothetical protein
MFSLGVSLAPFTPLPMFIQTLSLDGYTLEEKAHIAQTHLLPKQIKRHGLRSDSVVIPQDVMRVCSTALHARHDPYPSKSSIPRMPLRTAHLQMLSRANMRCRSPLIDFFLACSHLCARAQCDRLTRLPATLLPTLFPC